ncbi:sporulation kinase [Desulfosporosinus sp. BG]|nr:sporulation kinase [Desulfosporosinus sp. BG]
MYYNFVTNVLVVLFFCGFTIWTDLSLKKKYSPYILGIMFGLITIFVMHGRITVVEGRFYDFRHVTMTMAGFIGGPVTALIAALISCLYRYNVGGSGSMGGIASITTFACFGSILGRYLRNNQNGKKVLFWLVIGIVMAFVLIFIIAFIPPWKSNLAKILGVVAAPYLIITPLATTIIFNFYFWTYEFFAKAAMLNAIVNCSPLNIIIFDGLGPILSSKNTKTQLQCYPYIKHPNLLLDSDSTWLDTTKQQHKEITTEDGRHFTADLSNFQMPSSKYACVAIVNDVTEIKRMQTERVEQLSKHLKLEAELSRSNQLIADIINNMPDGFYALDNQWRFTFVNKKAEELLLKKREELLGKVLGDVIPQVQGSILELNYQNSKNNYLPMTFEYLSFLHQDTWYQVNVYPSSLGVSVYYTDVTERKLAHEKLIKSQDAMTSILESMTDCFYAINRDWQFSYINRAGEIVFGKSRNELLGKKMTEVFKVNDAALLRYQEVMNENKSVNFEIISEALGNKWFEVNAYPTETGMTCYFRDITSRKRTEIEIARLDRLNLVGQLAAGIGHEIRNPITTVRGYIQLLSLKPDYEAQKSTFELMISELDRANSIITEFLSLAQTKQTELKSQNLNHIFDNLYPLLEADAFNQNKQICYIPAEVPNLELNTKEISQLILNLTRNGLEAMQERGCLTVKIYSHEGKVVLAIADEGSGISQENISKLGTPFFTTKENGTGLGLATCYKIADSHNAKIHIDSTPRGTTFFILFPIPNKEQEQNERIA